MLFLYVVFVLSLVAVLIAGLVEQRRHEANLDAIRARILVNGIRGKSSITRLCAGALRGGGHACGSEDDRYRRKVYLAGWE